MTYQNIIETIQDYNIVKWLSRNCEVVASEL